MCFAKKVTLNTSTFRELVPPTLDTLTRAAQRKAIDDDKSFQVQS